MARLMNALKWRLEHRVDPMASAPDPPEWATYQFLRVRRWTGREAEGRPVQVRILTNSLQTVTQSHSQTYDRAMP
eukprot:7882391-Pyramimonas_sp.AAC.1